MKIFISWSGPHAMSIAKVLKPWLKNTFDSAVPWVSDEDISGGQVSLAEIARALAGAKFGIVVTTKANQDAPWLSYEAGAMSREVDGGETRVMPMLVDLRVSDLTSPLKQYQAARFDAEGIGKMIKSIGEVIGLDAEQISNKIETRGPELERLLAEVPEPSASGAKPARAEADVLDEILTSVRALRRDFDSRPPRGLARNLSELRLGDMRGTRGPGIETSEQYQVRMVANSVAAEHDVRLFEVRFEGANIANQVGNVVIVVDSSTLDPASAMEFAHRMEMAIGREPQIVMVGSREFIGRAPMTFPGGPPRDLVDLAHDAAREEERDALRDADRDLDREMDQAVDREIDRRLEEKLRAAEDGPDPDASVTDG